VAARLAPKQAAAPVAADAPPAPLPSTTRLGAGDGLRGPSALYCVCRDMLQSSLMDASKSEQRRDAFFAAMTLFHHVSRHSDVAGVLAYTPASMELVNPPPPAAGGAGSRAAPAPPPFRAWLFPPDLLPAGDVAAIPLPAHCVAALVGELCKQAHVFVKSSTAMRGVSVPVSGGRGGRRRAEIYGLKHSYGPLAHPTGGGGAGGRRHRRRAVHLRAGT
jgi:hypothetical protein